jgi:hypothetical protein
LERDVFLGATQKQFNIFSIRYLGECISGGLSCLGTGNKPKVAALKSALTPSLIPESCLAPESARCGRESNAQRCCRSGSGGLRS